MAQMGLSIRRVDTAGDNDEEYEDVDQQYMTTVPFYLVEDRLIEGYNDPSTRGMNPLTHQRN